MSRGTSLQTAVSRSGIVCPSALILTKENFTKISKIVFRLNLFDKTSQEIIKWTVDAITSNLNSKIGMSNSLRYHLEHCKIKKALCPSPYLFNCNLSILQKLSGSNTFQARKTTFSCILVKSYLINNVEDIVVFKGYSFVNWTHYLTIIRNYDYKEDTSRNASAQNLFWLFVRLKSSSPRTSLKSSLDCSAD